MLEAFPNTASSIAFRLPSIGQSNKANPVHLFFFLMLVLVSGLGVCFVLFFKYIHPGNL